MIFARDKSQMCNNLLQYAHVYAWGREHGRRVVSMRFSYKYRYFHICHTPLTGMVWYLAAKYAAAVGLLPTASFKHEDCDREALERKMLSHRHIVVSGWYARWYDLFLKYRDEICQLFAIDEVYAAPVRQKMQQAEQGTPRSQIVRLGVHIRRGDYDRWQDGRYYFDDAVYGEQIARFVELMPDRQVHVYLSTNDARVSVDGYQRLCPGVVIHHLQGAPAEDLFMLSECDYLIGPPSTFSLVAAMYRDIPLYRMDQPDASCLTLDSFRRFDYWFRHII